MSDAFYNFVVFVCRHPFLVSSSPIVLHRDRIPLTGRVILAPNHLSEYDVPCLMHISPRNLDFVSVVELFRKPLVGWFFRNMNAFALDRSRVDPATTRTIFNRLEQDRAVVIFPEGHLRSPGKSVLSGGPFKSSLIRIAQLTGAPILPAVILGTRAYTRPASWLPMPPHPLCRRFWPAHPRSTRHRRIRNKSSAHHVLGQPPHRAPRRPALRQLRRRTGFQRHPRRCKQTTDRYTLNHRQPAMLLRRIVGNLAGAGAGLGRNDRRLEALHGVVDLGVDLRADQ